MEITINYYGQAVSVSVEVYEYLTQADHKAENLAHEQRQHWDGREFDEYIISTEGCLSLLWLWICYAIEPHFGGVRYKTLTMSEMRPQCLVNQGFFEIINHFL